MRPVPRRTPRPPPDLPAAPSSAPRRTTGATRPAARPNGRIMEGGPFDMSTFAARAVPGAIALSAAVAAAPSSIPGPRTLEHVAESERAAYIRRAIVWTPTDVVSKDLMAGPPHKDGFAFDQKVSCDYVEPAQPLGGTTPKFLCALSPDDIVKVKYGRKNGEVYAAVAASRLLWARGFAPD